MKTIVDLNENVIFRVENDMAPKDLVELAISNKISLENALLSGLDLSGINLREINLIGVDFSNSNLSHSNLFLSNFQYANLENTNFNSAHFSKVNMVGVSANNANFQHAYLIDCNAENSFAINTNFNEATFLYSILTNSVLQCANFKNASLKGTNFRGSDLSYANLENIKCNLDTQGLSLICPSEGSFIGWKKCGDYIVKLKICADAKRSNATTKKCRCSQAEVLAIEALNGDITKIKKVHSNFDLNFTYEIGSIVEVPDFCDNRWKECAKGIHFFIDRDDAVNY